MRLRHQRRVRRFNRLIVFSIALIFFFFRTQLAVQFLNTLFYAQTPEYHGGLIDEVQIMRCYHWFRQCDSLVGPRNEVNRELLAWSRVSKNFTVESSYAIQSGSFYNTYLYVHRWKTLSALKPISDFAISKDPATVPLSVLTDVQKLIKSSDSSVFHKHVYHQRTSVWDYLSFWRQNSRDDVHLLGEDWKYKGGSIWCKYQNGDDPVIDIQIYLGAGFIESRPHWREVMHEYFRPNNKDNEYIPISITRKVRSFSNKNLEPFDSSLHLKLSKNHANTLKVLQITDVHFKCSDDGLSILNEFQTVNFIANVIEIESPDMVVITGDFLDGPNSFDFQTCIMKLVQPMIKKGIPYAFSVGYMDFSRYATQSQLKDFVMQLPYCLNKWSSTDGHMAVEIKLNSGSEIVIYVLDSFMSIEPFFVERERLKLPQYSLAFRHLPINDYRPEGSFPLIGKYNERSALQLNTEINQNVGNILNTFKVMALSCGYEHNNDCCLRSKDDIWLCYGGSTGVGLPRMTDMNANIRMFKIDDDKGEVKSWKRSTASIESVYDYQYIRVVQHKG